jgi:sodium/proline symporter
MASSDFVAITLVAASATLLLATWVLQARVHIGEDFALARRRLAAAFTGLSQAINCVPAWLLLMLSLLAYSTGLAAVWMALATLIGLAINWWWVAPRLRIQVGTSSYTLSQWFAASAGDNLHATTRRSATAIVVVSVGLTTITLLQWAALHLSMAIGVTATTALALLVVLFLLCTVFGGMWSASIADVMQVGVLSVALPLIAGYALFAVGGWQPLWSAIAARESVAGPWFAGYSGVLAIALLVGYFFAGLGSAAQPSVLARYWACRDDATLRRARWMAMAWSVVVLAVALLIGWCARALLNDADSGRELLTSLAKQTMPDALASLVATGVMMVLALNCVSQWVAVATHLAIDLRDAAQPLSLVWCRGSAFVFALFIGGAAMYLPRGGEDTLWLCWHALSAALGPLLLVRLTGKKVRPGSLLGAMWSGFVLTVLFHLMPDTPGDLLERSLPFIAAMGIALSGGDQRRNPNRADRGDKTVHDHLSI